MKRCCSGDCQQGRNCHMRTSQAAREMTEHVKADCKAILCAVLWVCWSLLVFNLLEQVST